MLLFSICLIFLLQRDIFKLGCYIYTLRFTVFLLPISEFAELDVYHSAITFYDQTQSDTWWGVSESSAVTGTRASTAVTDSKNGLHLCENVQLSPLNTQPVLQVHSLINHFYGCCNCFFTQGCYCLFDKKSKSCFTPVEYENEPQILRNIFH